ncbi:MAG: M48 family metalloprotease [Proteobacteria bacterium]|nr:M48 family metalloprotease [Pseudomonadota bacterium]
MKHQINISFRALICIVCMLGVGLYVVPADSAEKVGTYEKLHRQYIADNPLYPDANVQAYINKVGQRMAAVSKSRGFEYKFFLIDSFDVNAFAAPGGYIYFNRGLFIQLKTEAQLAAVLGHEVGHIAGRHHERGKAKRGGGTFLTILTALMTGSGDAMQAADLLSQVSTYGHQRELEMEADEYGLEYLSKAGYDPSAMVEVIEILRSNRRFVGEIASAEGKTPGTYHGVYATHPRDDQRLRRGVGNLPGDSTITLGDDGEFREAVDGMLYGGGTMPENAPKLPPETYIDKTNRFSILFPKDWTTEVGPPLRSTSKNEKEWLEVQVSTRNGSKTPAEYIQSNMPKVILFGTKDVRLSGLLGHMGAVNTTEENAKSERLAVFFNGNRVYQINYYNSSSSSPRHDDQFQALLETFRPYREVSSSPQKLPRVRYVKAKQGMTFRALDRALNMGSYGEQQLRAINGYYPFGEPKPGEWIKIVQ